MAVEPTIQILELPNRVFEARCEMFQISHRSKNLADSIVQVRQQVRDKLKYWYYSFDQIDLSELALEPCAEEHADELPETTDSILVPLAVTPAAPTICIKRKRPLIEQRELLQEVSNEEGIRVVAIPELPGIFLRADGELVRRQNDLKPLKTWCNSPPKRYYSYTDFNAKKRRAICVNDLIEKHFGAEQREAYEQRWKDYQPEWKKIRVVKENNA